MARTIPETAFLYKDNLYIVETVVTVGLITLIKWELYTTADHCFYDDTAAENYDEHGGLRPENERLYYQYMIMEKDEDFVANHVTVVPVQEGFEIATTAPDHETA